MFHDSQAVLALSREPNPTVFQKTLGVNDFYFAGRGFDYPMGNIQMIGKSQAEMYRGEKPLETKLAPDWALARRGRARGRLLAVHRGPAGGSENRVTLDRDGNLQLAYTPTNPTAAEGGCTTSSSRCWASSACTPTT